MEMGNNDGTHNNTQIEDEIEKFDLYIAPAGSRIWDTGDGDFMKTGVQATSPRRSSNRSVSRGLD